MFSPLKCIVSPLNDAAFNLAAEEYLFKNESDNVLFLYANQPSVVVGKHQNALAEINYRFVFENNIGVFRRISGGGAVYHDLGNLNFSFHQTVADPSKVSWRTYIEPVVLALNDLGIGASIGQRNEILVNDFKVSGHAAHVYRKRVLSHGTLLVSANRESLSASLNRSDGQCVYHGRAIQSVRSKIANLNQYLPSLQVELLMKHLAGFMEMHYGGSPMKSFTMEQEIEISKLADEKYRTWEWNMAYSPAYVCENQVEVKGQMVSFKLKVEKGRITLTEASASSAHHPIVLAIHSLNGEIHHEQTILQKLERSLSESNYSATDIKKIVNSMF